MSKSGCPKHPRRHLAIKLSGFLCSSLNPHVSRNIRKYLQARCLDRLYGYRLLRITKCGKTPVMRTQGAGDRQLPDQDAQFKNVFKRNPGKIIIFEGLVEFCFTHLFYGKSHMVKLSVTPFSMDGSPSRLGRLLSGKRH